MGHAGIDIRKCFESIRVSPDFGTLLGTDGGGDKAARLDLAEELRLFSNRLVRVLHCRATCHHQIRNLLM